VVTGDRAALPGTLALMRAIERLGDIPQLGAISLRAHVEANRRSERAATRRAGRQLKRGQHTRVEPFLSDIPLELRAESFQPRRLAQPSGRCHSARESVGQLMAGRLRQRRPAGTLGVEPALELGAQISAESA
jgi:hypothetical protein